MRARDRQSWFGSAILIGLLYSVIGVVFALPPNHVHIWRLSAWLLSAAVYAVHIGYEHFRLRNSPSATALHVAIAVAIGAFGLAVAANVHEILVGPAYRRRLALAFVAWPVLTGLPAFIVALVVAYGLTLTRRRS
jgi:hypothetical protein